VMHAFAVGDVWVIGSATARKLTSPGIHIFGALREMPMKQARAVGTVVLERLIAELRGVPPTLWRRSSRGGRAWPSHGRSERRSATSDG
jgi:nucleotidyltransferase/DNA polymerase involved in DNA repair